MNPQKFRWSKVYESSEEELLHFLEARKVTAKRTHIDEFEQVPLQNASDTVTLWCADGSFTLVTDTKRTSMQPGDAVRIAPATAFEIHAGISGCSYYTSL